MPHPSRASRRIGWARVTGPSMESTLTEGDRVLLLYGARARTGDVVAVRLPPGPSGPRPVAIKRLTRIESDGSLWVESDAPGRGTDSWQVGALPPSALVAVAPLRMPRRGGRLRWLRARR